MSVKSQVISTFHNGKDRGKAIFISFNNINKKLHKAHYFTQRKCTWKKYTLKMADVFYNRCVYNRVHGLSAIEITGL